MSAVAHAVVCVNRKLIPKPDAPLCSAVDAVTFALRFRFGFEVFYVYNPPGGLQRKCFFAILFYGSVLLRRKGENR